MPTIQDVAKQAGVAPVTVSRVLNNASCVSSETRERVRQAIAELRYVPNSVARSLRVKETKTIALVLTDITNPFWTTVARGVEDCASKNRYSVILCNTDESLAKEMDYLNVVLQRQVDGVLLVPARSAAKSLKLIKKHNTTVVVLDRQVPFEHVDKVRCESEAGAYKLTQHLLELGHRRIAVLSGPRHVSTAMDRVMGYCCALREAGLEVDTELVYHGKFTQSSGYRMARRALATQPRPTAVFAANNFIAIGAVQALGDAGLRIPDDIAVVAFDDLPPGLILNPFLTAATQPGYEMGYRATELLLARLSGQAPEAYQEIILPTDIVIRQSSVPQVEPRASGGAGRGSHVLAGA